MQSLLLARQYLCAREAHGWIRVTIVDAVLERRREKLAVVGVM
jgi:hypothetical protein